MSQLISRTTTTAGWRVKAELDQRQYPEGIRASDEELGQVNLEPHPFLPDWNYTIRHS